MDANQILAKLSLSDEQKDQLVRKSMGCKSKEDIKALCEEFGVTITDDEMEMVLELVGGPGAIGELSDEDLDRVAGGEKEARVNCIFLCSQDGKGCVYQLTNACVNRMRLAELPRPRYEYIK